MISAAELRRWLSTLPPDAEVGIDEGGLTLRVYGDPEPYIEVGGLPEEPYYWHPEEDDSERI